MESCTLSLERTAGACPSLMLPAGGRGASHLAPYLGRAADEVSFVAPARETWTENRQGIFFFKIIYLFGCTESSLLCTAFSNCGKQGLLSSCGSRASHCGDCGGFSCCRAWVQGHAGFSGCGSQALEHRRSSCGPQAELLLRVWDLPRPRMEPTSHAQVGRFFATEPPGKPPSKI